MARLAELKLRFRLRMAIPILEAPWRKKLHSSLPVPQYLGDGWLVDVGGGVGWLGGLVGGFRVWLGVGWGLVGADG